MAGKLRIFAAIAAFAAFAAPAASAGTLTSVSASCDSGDLTQPFSQWGDQALYAPVPGGAFANGQAAWAFSGGGRGVSGNEPYHVRSADDAQSLYIPAGGVATS